jgi:large subunit ribosomal protein L3
MEKFILTKKVGMSQLFEGDGRSFAVTLLEALPNVVTQIKTTERDGYAAVQVGLLESRRMRVSKARKGHLADLPPVMHIREFKPGNIAQSRGERISVGAFVPGDKVKVRGRSIGKGFQGVVKRHGFAGGPASHGHRDVLRRPGAIGGRFPQRVLKGKRMAGRTGGVNVSVLNLTVVKVDEAKNLLFVKGAVPGKRGTLLEVTA